MRSWSVVEKFSLNCLLISISGNGTAKESGEGGGGCEGEGGRGAEGPEGERKAGEAVDAGIDVGR